MPTISNVLDKEPTHRRLANRIGLALSVTCVLLFGLAVAQPAQAFKYCYGCVFNGTQEVPPNASPALGGGQFLIDTIANTVTYHLAFTGLGSAEVGAHIHGPAAPGANAAVVLPLPPGNPKAGVWNYPEAFEADILAGRAYVNIHTAGIPGGEIRGQIVPLNAQLNGAQETPPVATPGSGWGVFAIDTSTNTLQYWVAFGGLTGAETAAHIHGTALHQAAGGVLTALPAGSPKVGVWNYPEALESDILTGKTYVNIHSVPNPGGEIRGQIVPIVTPLDGGQEVPPNASTGAGIALVAYDDAANTLSVDVRYGGLAAAETGAHIHGFAPPGANAGVQAPLPAGTPKLATWAYGAANEANVFDGLAYINIHSAAVPGGEIRGQMMCFLSAPTSSVPALASRAIDRLSAGRPNPFTIGTTLDFRLERSMSVSLDIFDSSGRRVANLLSGERASGDQSVGWDGRDDQGHALPSGIYWAVLDTPAGKSSRSLNLLR